MHSPMPPNNIELEASFIGEILIEPAILRKSTIRPEEFYLAKHERIYAELKKIFEREGTVDLLLVSDAMAVKEPHIGAYLSNCLAQVASTASWRYHEDALIRLHKARSLLAEVMRVQDLIIENPQNVDALCMEVVGMGKNIHAKGRVDIMPYSEVIHEAYGAVVKRSEHPGFISGVTFGMEELDYFTDGLQPGEMCVVAARTGVGKSAFSQGVMLAAAKEGCRVGLINLEMNSKQMGIRAMASRAKMGISDLRRGKVFDWTKLNEVAGVLADLPIWVTNTAFSVSKIARAIDSMANKGCKLVILDYIQLVQPESTGKQNKTREQEVSEVSRMIKRKAQELDIAVVALAQINRQSASTADGRPQLHHLRESGAIEQDSDLVILLHPLIDECECPLECFCGKRDSMELFVAKGRSTGMAKFEVKWDAQTTTFSSKAK